MVVEIFIHFFCERYNLSIFLTNSQYFQIVITSLTYVNLQTDLIYDICDFLNLNQNQIWWLDERWLKAKACLLNFFPSESIRKPILLKKSKKS